LVIGALLQCLPAAEFWHGGSTNALTAMTKYMTAIAQPHWLTTLVRHVGKISSAMGGGFNIVIILWLLICAAGLWESTKRGWRWPVRTLIVGAIFFWIVAEDMAIYGGLATDLNSLVPLATLAWCAMPGRGQGVRQVRLLPREMTSSAGAVVATFGAAMLAFSIVSMSVASLAGAENTLFLAQNGPASELNVKAKVFTLTDQHNKPYTLGEHSGRTTLLTFLDPHCWTDCPLLANQLAHVRSELGANVKLDIVAVAADPYHEKLSDVRKFMREHHLYGVKNFYFVTGPLHKTSAVWSDFGESVTMKPTDKMSIHSDLMFIITSNGTLRWVIPDDPIGTAAGTASAVTELKTLLALEGIH
jgi:cytochrome oxidase Cu insertion factor (SCO1/SenC/PrrC family)